jgi:hypothetical protein
MTYRNINGLKTEISYRVFDLAKTILGLTDGKPRDHEHHQPCIIPGCTSDNDAFYVRSAKKTFHCRRCGFNGDLLSLVEKVRGVSFAEAFDIIADAAGFVDTTLRSSKPAGKAKREIRRTDAEQKGASKLETFELTEDSDVFMAVHEHRSEISFDTYHRFGSVGFSDKRGCGVAIPMFDVEGKESGYVRYYEDGGKPKISAGAKSGIVGIATWDALRSKRPAQIVFVTAGVSDCLVASELIAKAGLEADYYCFTNGAGEGEKLDKFDPLLRPALDGQAVCVIQDNDEVGKKAAMERARYFSQFAAEVRILSLPSERHDMPIKDLRDFVAIDGTLDDLLYLFKESESVKAESVEPAASSTNSEILYSPEFCDKILADLMVDIFGQDEERHIYGFSNYTMRRFVIKNRNYYTLRDLIGDCGTIVDRYVVADKETEVEGKYMLKQVIDIFVRAATKHNIRDSELRGQGIWLDPQTQHAVIVLGGGQAAVWNGTTLEKLTKPFYGGLQLNFQAADIEFVDFDMLKKALENYDNTKASTAFVELKKLLMQWNWKTPDKDITVTLIAALAVASFIQSTFKFRPLACVCGPSQSGKSDLQTELFVPLFGRLADPPLQKPSEAAIRQSVGRNSKMLMIDELEKSKYRGEVLKLLRTSTDGGKIPRGQPNGKVQLFGIKHIVWISSIEMNLANSADASRFFQFEPQRPERIDGKRPILKLDPQVIRKMGFDMMVFTIKEMQTLLQTVKALSMADIAEAAPRNIEAAAVPAAFAEKLCGWSREKTHAFMYSAIHDNSPQSSTEVTDDHQDLLQSILFQSIRVRILGDLSVIQAIRKSVCDSNNNDYEYTDEALERNGITIITPHGSGYHVFFKPKVVEEVLLKSTDWKGTNVKQLLKRIDGAKESSAKFSGKTAKGISIPLASIIDRESQVEDDKSETADNQNVQSQTTQELSAYYDLPCGDDVPF